MGNKKVCFTCRKAFSVSANHSDIINLTCPECGNQTTMINHKFRPPKQDDIGKWKVVEFLKNHGFIYQHIYSEYSKSGFSGQLQYPVKMEEAKEFVIKNKAQAYSNKKS